MWLSNYLNPVTFDGLPDEWKGYNMVQLSQTVEAVETEVRVAELLPQGYYKAVALGEEEKDSKTGGKYIKIEFEIVQGEHSRRKLWENYNIVNNNQVAVKIALEKLGSFAWAANIDSLKDTKDLLFKEVTIEVGISPAKGDFSASNSIKAFWPFSWTDAEIEAHKKAKKSGGSASAPAAATASPVAKKPWAK